jgi:hypothetical protein
MITFLGLRDLFPPCHQLKIKVCLLLVNKPIFSFAIFFGLTRSVSTMPSTEDQGMSLVGEQTDLLFCNTPVASDSIEH